MADRIDLTTANSSEDIGGAIFLDSANVGSGTGNYNTFLKLENNDGDVAGFNSDFNDPSNSEIGASQTETVLLANIPIVIIDGVEYYAFRVDLNEKNSDPAGQITLNTFTLYASDSGTIAALSDLQDPDIADVVYDMDTAYNDQYGTTDGVTLELSEVSTGSGTDDYSVLVPVSEFEGYDPATTYLYLYVDMGEPSSDYEENSGFEEWNTQTAGTIQGIKFEDENRDGRGGRGNSDQLLRWVA